MTRPKNEVNVIPLLQIITDRQIKTKRQQDPQILGWIGPNGERERERDRGERTREIKIWFLIY